MSAQNAVAKLNLFVIIRPNGVGEVQRNNYHISPLVFLQQSPN